MSLDSDEVVNAITESDNPPVKTSDSASADTSSAPTTIRIVASLRNRTRTGVSITKRTTLTIPPEQKSYSDLATDVGDSIEETSAFPVPSTTTTLVSPDIYTNSEKPTRADMLTATVVPTSTAQVSSSLLFGTNIATTLDVGDSMEVFTESKTATTSVPSIPTISAASGVGPCPNNNSETEIAAISKASKTGAIITAPSDFGNITVNSTEHETSTSSNTPTVPAPFSTTSSTRNITLTESSTPLLATTSTTQFVSLVSEPEADIPRQIDFNDSMDTFADSPTSAHSTESEPPAAPPVIYPTSSNKSIGAVSNPVSFERLP